MAKAPKISYASLEDLFLDPTNPRLGRRIASPELSQEQVLNEMMDWTLEELAVSFLESGFWPQEALIVVTENLYGENRLVVIEGNRRLAALKLLAKADKDPGAKNPLRDILKNKKLPGELLSSIPYIEVSSRKEVSAYLGFRHVTGIKEWNPAEKAQFIAHLIEDEKLSYDDVRRRIGSKTPTVRANYISYRLLLQMDNQEKIEIDKVENKFSVLYLSLRTQGVQSYLNIDIMADPEAAKTPVPKEHLGNLVNFSRWLFGDKKSPPLFSDSRQVDAFGKILESENAIEYLERTKEPRFEIAYQKAGVGEDDLVRIIDQASDNIQLSLTEAHIYRKKPSVEKAVSRLAKDALALISLFPSILEELRSEANGNARPS